MITTKKPTPVKAKKMPKRPKSTASVQTWEAYEAKCKTIAADNDKAAKAYSKALKDYETGLKTRKQIQERTKKMK